MTNYLTLFGSVCVSTLSEQKGDTGARTTFLITTQRLVGGGQGLVGWMQRCAPLHTLTNECAAHLAAAERAE